VSQPTARLCIIRVTEALVRRKHQFVYMPNTDQMQETATRMFDRFKLPCFALGVDGVQIRFEGAPRKIPANKTTQMYWSRKQCHSINAQVVVNDRYICDLDVGWPGSTHDARIWNRSEVKRHIEHQRRFLVAADSGYRISENLVKPYPTAESANDRRKALFNRRLSGLRTVMTENLYGVWKRRFPILKALRTDYELSQKIVVASAVLFNLARMWQDEDFNEEINDPGSDDEEGFIVVEDAAPVRTVRLRGQVLRDQLKDLMPM
jgi:hypothetical protein